MFQWLSKYCSDLALHSYNIITFIMDSKKSYPDAVCLVLCLAMCIFLSAILMSLDLSEITCLNKCVCCGGAVVFPGAFLEAFGSLLLFFL